MRRHLPEVAAALLCLAAGMLAAGRPAEAAPALGSALTLLLLFRLLRKFLAARPDAHQLKVTALTLLLWVPLFGFFLPLIAQQGGPGTCTPDFDLEAVAEAAPARHEATADAPAAPSPAAPTPNETGGAGLTVYVCDGARGYADATNSVWAGVVDVKATSKPRPSYPKGARAAGILGKVAVVVTVDESGRVQSAQAVSGHALLRRPALEAACLARFSPLLADGPPVRVSGVLTYDFGR